MPTLPLPLPSPMQFLFLLLVMSCESFGAVLKGIFFVFGDALVPERFHALVSYLAPDMDPDVTSAFLAELGTQLAEVAEVTYDVAASLPVVQPKL